MGKHQWHHAIYYLQYFKNEKNSAARLLQSHTLRGSVTLTLDPES